MTAHGMTSRPPVGLVPDSEGRYHPCSDIECKHDACYGMRELRSRERADGHAYRGPGYCRTCGYSERLHDETQA